MSTTKSGHERWVAIAEGLRPILEKAVRSKLPNARVIVTAMGETPKRQSILTRLKALEEKIGMKAWSLIVGARGFEPPTPRPPVWCANQAALRPAIFA